MFRERPGEMVWDVLLRADREVVAESSEDPGMLRCEYSESRKKPSYVKELKLIC